MSASNDLLVNHAMRVTTITSLIEIRSLGEGFLSVGSLLAVCGKFVDKKAQKHTI